MKLYKNLLLLCLLAIGINTYAIDLTGVRIYINPGHGGFDGANDRNIRTIPYDLEDQNGFWESQSNLDKGLKLRDLLEAQGATVMMSRTLNRDEDDRSLSEIAAEASANNMDAFLSIHSNALGVNKGTNYLLFLMRGTDDTPDPAESKLMATDAWPYLYDNPLTNWTYYSLSNPNIRGDWSFYGYHLGVLRDNTVPGFLSEGEFHDYQPETHRLLNMDYKHLESYRFVRYFKHYFGAEQSDKGIIAGAVKSSNEIFSHTQYLFKAGTNDQWKPINKATVELQNEAGDVLDTYETDTCYNGIYVFYDLAPGNYKVKISAEDYISKTEDIVVTAGTTTSIITQIQNVNVEASKPVPADYPDPKQEAGAMAMSHYKTMEVSDSATTALDNYTVRKSVYHNDTLFVLTTDPKIIAANPTTGEVYKEISINGVEGGSLLLSDIAFSSDNHLVACNKDTISFGDENRSFKVYVWDTLDSDPTVLLSSNQQGAWYTSVVGESFAISGAIWRCKVYTGGVTTGSSHKLRVIGYTVDKDLPGTVGYSYMIDNSYTEELWGAKYTFTMSPRMENTLIVDGENMLPTEYTFEWAQPDRSPLTNHGTIAEGTLSKRATGASYFKYAQHDFMIAPNCTEEGTKATAQLLDITDGLDKATIISDVMPAEGLGEMATTQMSAGATVNGYDINLFLFAPFQGLASYTTVTTDAIANIYAYDLRMEKQTEQYKFSFALNENATDVTIEFTDNNGNIVGTYSAGTMDKGAQEVLVPFASIPYGKDMNWQVKATAEGTVKPVRMTGDETQVQFYSPYGVVVDNHTESDNFGRIYVSNSKAGTCGSGRVNVDNGIYILDPLFADITNQGDVAYSGNVGFNTASSSSPFRLSISEDGRLFISDWNDAHAGVYVMDTTDPTKDFSDLFAGEGVTRASNGIRSKDGVEIGGSSASCYVLGNGDDTKLYVFDEDYQVDELAGNILQYNIGTATSWNEAPSAIAFNNKANGSHELNMNSVILPDGKGGWWISQYRSADEAAIPCLLHYNGTEVDYISGKVDPTVIEESRYGGCAISEDGTRIAIAGNNTIKILDVTYDENNVPQVKRLYTITPAIGSKTNSLAFDCAGNVYAVSNSDERLAMWALPKADNSHRTPAQRKQVITNESSAVSNLTAVQEGFNNVKLTWDTMGESISYNVYADDVLLATTDTASYTDMDVADGTVEYAVKVVSGTYESAPATVSIEVAASCEAVSNLTATPVGLDAVTLTWDATVVDGKEVSYNIYKDDNLLTNVTENTYEDTMVESGSHLYEVTVVVGSYESEASKVTISVTSIEETTIAAKIYPNPTNGPATISSNEEIQQIRIFNTNGRLVNQLEGFGAMTQDIDLSNLPAGTYLVQVNTNKAIRVIRK